MSSSSSTWPEKRSQLADAHEFGDYIPNTLTSLSHRHAHPLTYAEQKIIVLCNTIQSMIIVISYAFSTSQTGMLPDVRKAILLRAVDLGRKLGFLENK